MALSASTIWEVQTGGSDTANGGAFDPSQTAGMFSDGASTSSTSATPNFSSVSYSFTSNDVGAWVYIASGTNWIAGWYKITAISGTAATLDAAIGHAVLKTTLVPSTVQGVGATASATWTIDYSQGANSGAGPAYTFTHLSSTGAGLTVSGGLSGEHTFGKQDVGNCLVITGGTNFNTGRYVIASVAAGVATVVGPTNIHSVAGTNSDGAGSLGGALASLGLVGSVAVGSNVISIKTGTYSVTSATTNVAAGCFASTALNLRIFGYGTVRSDLTSPPTLQASGISTAVLFASPNGGNWYTENIIADGASLTSLRGFALNSGQYYKLTAINCTNNGLTAGGANSPILIFCKATGCSTQPAIASFSVCYFCEAYSNTVTGFSISGTSINLYGCLSYANTGATSDGFSGGVNTQFVGCTSYGNGRDGFRNTTNLPTFINCIAEGNGVTVAGFGFNLSGVPPIIFNCGVYNNNSANTSISFPSFGRTLSLVTATSTFFVNAASGNFALNNVSTGGVLARSAALPGTFPAGTSVGYLDIGAVQARWPMIPMGIQGVI